MARTAARAVGIDRVATTPTRHPRSCKQPPSAFPTRPAPTMDNVSGICCVSIQGSASFTVQKIRPDGIYNFEHLLDFAVRPDCIPVDYSGNTCRLWNGPPAVALGRSSVAPGRCAADFGDFCGT